MSIQAKLIIGFAFVVLLAAAQGAVSVLSIGSTGLLVSEMYDKPLMAISFTRSAKISFGAAEREFLVATQAESRNKSAEFLERIEESFETFQEDLEVVKERMPTARAVKVAGEIEAISADWWTGAQSILETNASSGAKRSAIASAATVVNQKLDLLVEYASEDGYNFRSASVASAEETKVINVAMVAFGLLAGLATAIVLARGISRPVTGMTEAMTALAGGDMKVEIPAIERKDEIGEMAKAVQVFRDKAVEAEWLAASQAEMEHRQKEEHEQRTAEKAEEEARRAAEKAEEEARRAAAKAGEEAREAAETVKLAEAQAERERQEREKEARRIEEQHEAKEHQRLEDVRRVEEKRKAEAAAEAAKRDAEQRTRAERRQAMLDLADSFESQVGGVIEKVSHASAQMQSSAQSMSVNAEQTSEKSMTVASASDEASSNVRHVATSADQLASSIQEISRQVTHSADIARDAVNQAETTNEKVHGLVQSAQKIGDVVQLINDIASQTNLLALNATIEAARAGEAGKGFAVVANEVKSLAGQTAKATEEIGAQIVEIRNATNETVQAIGDIGGTISKIDEISSAIASAVEEQGAATQEIASSVQRAASSTNDVSSNIADVTDVAGETGNAANQVLNAVNDLSQQTNVLRGSVDEFLNRVRTA